MISLTQKFLFLIGLATLLSAEPILVPPTLLTSLLTKKVSTVNVLISLEESRGVATLFKNVDTPLMEFPNRESRINFVVDTLRTEADKVQKNLLNFLFQEKSTPVSVTQLWITNQIILRNADLSTIQKLLDRSDISKIEEETLIELHLPLQSESGAPSDVQVTNDADLYWGVDKINARAVWENGTRGTGIVVASIDTGVRANHVALRSSFREENGWYDAVDNRPDPYDDQGHGTHTMGTIVGSNNIGVAPGAQWISCKGCQPDGCYSADLYECAQWILCPTNATGQNANCSLAPHVVSNSWGGGIMDTEFIEAWRSAGIIPVFSIGNEGQKGCGSAGSPGTDLRVIGVGASDPNDTITVFSSRGPSYNGDIKPDIVAPGYAIRSAYNLSDTSYVEMHGTSMACPHVAGLVALLLDRYDQQLQFDEIMDMLRSGAVTTVSTGMSCFDIPDSIYPNYHVGFGRVDAFNSIMGIKVDKPTTEITTPSSSSLNSSYSFFIIFILFFGFILQKSL